MKTLILILWYAGLVYCDKLDRTYLPPPGSIAAGGYHEDLNLPLEYPRENHPLALDPSSDRIIGDVILSPDYPNIALGIDRQVPSISASAESFTPGPGLSVSTNIYSVPSTTTSYAFSTTTTALPVRVESYAGIVPVTTISEGSQFDPTLNYDQYLTQQIIDPNSLQELNEKTDQLHPDSQFGNRKIPNLQELQQNPSIDIDDNMYMLSRHHNEDSTEPKLINFNNVISMNKTSQSSPEQPSMQDGGDLDSISTLSIPAANNSNPVKFVQQDTFGTYSMQKNPEDNNGKIEESQKFYNPFKTNSPLFIANDINKEISERPTVDPTNNDNFITRSNSKIQPERIQADTDRNAVILDYRNILTPEGFAYSFDTSNGIHADESGTAYNGVQAKGSYSFTGDDGKVYKIEYTADENGFLPRGDHLPTAPPIPDVILRGIQQAEKNRQMGIFDDGSYDDAKYGHARYQGVIGHIPQNRFNNFIINKAGNKENSPKTFQSFIKAEDHPEIYRKHEIDTISQTTSKSKLVENNNQDSFEAEDEKYGKPTSIDVNQSNSLSSDKHQNLNISDEFENGYKNKFRDNAMNSESRLNNENKRLMYENSDIIQGPYRVDDNENLHTGYEYIKPQNMNVDDPKNSLQSRFSNANEDAVSNLNDETKTERKTPKPFITPNVSFNFENQKTNPNTELLRTNLKEPFETSTIIDDIEKHNGKVSTIFENKIPDQINIEKNDYSVSDPEFMKSKPKYSYSAKPNYYQTKSYKDRTENNNYPSPSLVSQYTGSTTPMPSDPTYFNPGKISLVYPETASTISQLSSTLRPSSASRPQGIYFRPRLTGDLKKDNPRMRITNPTSFSQKINGKSGYRNRPDESSIQDDINKDLKSRFGVSTEPNTRASTFSTFPEDFSRPSSIEKVIGEDFSGPKQTQRFDPQRGYFY